MRPSLLGCAYSPPPPLQEMNSNLTPHRKRSTISGSVEGVEGLRSYLAGVAESASAFVSTSQDRVKHPTRKFEQSSNALKPSTTAPTHPEFRVRGRQFGEGLGFKVRV